MEDVTNQPFRRIAKRIADPGLMFTEFVSAMAVHYAAEKTAKKMRIHPEERPLGIQIFGGDPEIMAETARHAEEMGADILDINMGCWVPKVCRTGSGAALLKDPDIATNIVASVVKAANIPVTVKVRAGWDYSLFAAPDLAKRFEDCGIQAITLHARYAKQGFDGMADWELIGRLKQSVSIPVIGNGDIKEPDDARTMMRETGCDAVMVGRAAISNPWKLRDIRMALTGAGVGSPPTLKERVDTALEHIRLMIELEEREDLGTGGPTPELRACRALRGQIPLYIKGVQGAPGIRAKLSVCSSYDEYAEVLGTVLAENY